MTFVLIYRKELIKPTNHKFGERVVCSACKQNPPLTDYTEINKPVETDISICSFQLKHALFRAVEPVPEYNTTKSFVNSVTAPNPCRGCTLWNYCSMKHLS